jgi:hypothetical protein
MSTARLLIAGLMAVVITARADGAGPSGTFVQESDPTVVLTLSAADDGTVTGTLRDAVLAMPVRAQAEGTELAGEIGSAGQSLPFTAHLAGERLLLRVGPEDMAEVMSFRRADSAPATAADVAAVPAASTGGAAEAEAVSGNERHVTFNGQALSLEDLAGIEQLYRLRIPDADYWYDPVLGAWGVRGSPTLGFILPGLPLGGPLAADASGGGTAVFVNGRALHPWDLSALQQLVGSAILPGRYFITAQGLAGIEGGPPLWNLAELGRRNSDNPTNTWQSSVTGASGFSDGHTGAVFLPDGGIVSYGD